MKNGIKHEFVLTATADYSKVAGVNYPEAAKVLAVTDFFGFKMIVHADMPPNEMHVVQNGRCVQRFILQ